MKREGIHALLIAAFVASAAIGTTMLQDRALHHKLLAEHPDLIKRLDVARSQLVPISNSELESILVELRSEVESGLSIDRRNAVLQFGADEETDDRRFEWRASRQEIFRVIANRPASPATLQGSRPADAIKTYIVLPKKPNGSSYGVVGVLLGQGVNPISDPRIERTWPKRASKPSPRVLVFVDSELASPSKGEDLEWATPESDRNEAPTAGWSAWADEVPRQEKCTQLPFFFYCGANNRTLLVLQYREKQGLFGKRYQHRWRRESCGC